MTKQRLVTEDGAHVADLNDGRITNGHHRIHAMQQAGIPLFLDCGDGRPRAQANLDYGEIARQVGAAIEAAARTDFCGPQCTCRDRFGEVRCVKLLPGIDEWWRTVSVEGIDAQNPADLVAALNRLWRQTSSALDEDDHLWDARGALEHARQEIVLAIAFLGRDGGTERAPQTIKTLIERLAEADATIRKALSGKIPEPKKPPLDATIELWRGIERLLSAEYRRVADDPTEVRPGRAKMAAFNVYVTLRSFKDAIEEL
jgi:hypothetical protein